LSECLTGDDMVGLMFGWCAGHAVFGVDIVIVKAWVKSWEKGGGEMVFIGWVVVE
jgi:hypothetical protein